MKVNVLLRTVFILFVLVINVGCDQLSKKIVRKKIAYEEQINFIEDRVTLTKIENTGAFLSVGESLPRKLRILLLMILPVTALAVALVYVILKQELSWPRALGIAFVIGGGAGNIYDRIVHGSVTDFLHIDFGLFETSIFNMADVSIMAGMFLIIGEMYLKPLFTKRKAQETPVSE